MFKNDYQGGAAVEIFSAQGKDPVAKWRLCGRQSAIYKEFDKEVKGFVYSLEGSSQTIKMQLPKDVKMSLGLVQRFLVLQVNIPPFKDFSTELVITDSGHLKRRLYLSTVHKDLFATPLHARIPLVGVKRSIWCNMCIDLASFTRDLFKGAGFLTLDGITVSASCKVRRIFTTRTEATDGELFICGSGPSDEIPRSCQFLADVRHVTVLLSADRVRLASGNSECDQSPSDRSTSSRGPRTLDSSHIAFGSRVPRPPLPTGRRNGGAEEVEGRAYRGPNMAGGCEAGASSERQSAALGRERAAERDRPGASGLELAVSAAPPGILQPQPPRDGDRDRPSEKLSSRRLRAHRAGGDAPAPTGSTTPHVHGVTRAPPSSRGQGSQQPLAHRERGGDQAADETLSPRPSEDSGWYVSSRPPTELQDTGDGDQDCEPQLSMEEEDVFTFSSRPHSARRGQAHGEEGEEPGGRRGARPEEDFMASESDEDEAYTRFLQQRHEVRGGPASPPRSAGGVGDARPEAQPGSEEPGSGEPGSGEPGSGEPGSGEPGSREPGSGEPGSGEPLPAGSPVPAGPAPTRCSSPGAAAGHARGCRTPPSQTSIRDTPLGDHRPTQVDKGRSQEPVGGTSGDLRVQEEEEEELRMLASLRREKEEEEEEEEGGATGLSMSQIRRCNVSMSTSSDDTTTWTHIPVPANQGHHYQKEMNPLLHSNPREWMDVLSPPIPPPGLLKGSRDHRNTTRGAVVSDENRAENEEEYLNLLYDPCLNCYFDPQTGKYYELA